ncbi:MAG TPA: DMT family transporter [Alphaproteobacteria bacterium]|nr:DMT family transporter [Alphaproteobacteria bacterium]
MALLQSFYWWWRVTSSLPEDIPPEGVAILPPAPPLEQGVPRWLWLALGALFAWGFWAFLPKLALQSMPPHSVIFYEALGNLLVAVPVFIYLRGRLKWHGRTVPMAAFISAITVGAFLMYFFALKNGPVATIVTLTALYPVVVILLARVFLKEKLNRLQWLAVALAVAAAVLLAG